MLRIERRDAVTTLTLDRPEVGNALDVELMTRLAEALDALAHEQSAPLHMPAARLG